jgi:hypothetical protein
VTQLAVVALCVLALLAAALALPPVAGFQPGGVDYGDGDGGSGSGDGNGGGDGVGEIRPGNETGPPPEELLPTNESLDGGCTVVLLEEPVPGAQLPVLVVRDGARAPGVPVRFNGRLVGETDARGIVAGTVPYETALEVSVAVPADVECRFLDHEGEPRRSALAGFAASALASQPAGGDRANYSVDGAVAIGVRGEPYPGEEIEVVAAIEGVPMAEATVFVDGREVGRTDAAGGVVITVPDDGRGAVTVAVERGDFSGSRTVEVVLLQVGVSPTAPLAVPGGEATAIVTLGGEPVADARVTVDGTTVGTTDVAGRVGFTLPRDPTATVIADGVDQRARTAVWPVYVPTVASGLVVVGAFAVAYRRDGRRGLIGALAASGVVAGLTLAVVGLLRDRTALAAVGAGIAVAGACVLFWQREHWRSRSRAEARAFRRSLGRLGAAVARLCYVAALALERCVLWLGRRVRAAIARVRSMPRSLGGLWRALRAWLASLPARIHGILGAVIRAPWVLLAWWRGRGESSPETPEPAATTDRGERRTEERPFSLRAAWRHFARWVVPGPWRRRTPGEVARVALEQGFPDEPVCEFTGVFRDVEYGERPLTDDREGRAEAAFETLRRHRRAEEAED